MTMEELQTDTLSDYGKKQEHDAKKDNEDGCAAALLNGCEEVDDALDLMDHCDNESIATNSDVWKGSDSEDEDSFVNKETTDENTTSNEEQTDKNDSDKQNDPVEKSGNDKPDESHDKEKESVDNLKSNEVTETELSKQSGDDIESENVTKDAADAKEKEVINEQKEVSDDVKNSETEKESCDDTPTVIPEKTPPSTVETSTESSEKQKNDTTDEVSSADKADTDDVNKESSENVSSADKIDTDDANKETSENVTNRDNEANDECQMDYDAEDDDDFDPSLLCPEVSMAVDDNPVVTTNGSIPEGATDDNELPYEPVFSTFVDEVTGAEISFNLTAEEHELRKRLYGPTNPIEVTKIHCTACNVHLGSSLEGQNNRFVHPLLKVIICKECYHFYTSGDFDKDEDGSELYCRWCGQGGQVLCCSTCEFVFCKRCIRTNFGRKKMFEIRDSDNWNCFRCNQSQIITQRISCYEFFEYIRREMLRAAVYNSSEIWSKDHSRCCNNVKKRTLENSEEVKKTKRKKVDVDPDYNPLKDEEVINAGIPLIAVTSSVNTTTNSVFTIANKTIMLPKPIQILPKPNKPKDNDIEFVRQIPSPNVTIGLAPRPTYRTILPSVRPVLQPPTLVRISSHPVPTFIPTGNRILSSTLQNRGTNTSSMKHEWFEKTVRAAARVNSHLSYTLTQLNKAQTQAGSVEELAVVHNKLQEILSSSINSLIQIRKNLRTEFIAGIKTVRLPSKKPESFSNDDDVIFVSAPTTMSTPSTSTYKPPEKDPLMIVDPLKTPTVVKDDNWRVKPNEGPKRFLKVKTVQELQNVPSECITIPDDTSAPLKDSEKERSMSPVELVCNGETKTVDVDPLAIESSPEKETTATVDLSEVPNCEPTSIRESRSKFNVRAKFRESRTHKNRNNNLVYNLKDEPTDEIKRMMSISVILEKVDLEELQKKLLKLNQ